MSNYHLILGIYTAMAIIQLVYWCYLYRRLIFSQSLDVDKNGPKTPVTVIICTKNRLDKLKSNLPAILSQQYDQFFTLIVDDFSDVETHNYITDLQQKERYLLYYKVKQNKAGKKQAIAEAIVQAETQWLLMTDDDCKPQSDKWATIMMLHAEKHNKSIVLGYSPSIITDSFVSKWAHYETWITAVQYMSYAKAGIPYMGVGRNTLYRSDVISSENVLNHQDLISGDDDLTINQIANAENTTISVLPDSYMWTDGPRSWRNYYRQKRRHFTTPHRYKMIHKLLLGTFSVSQIIFFISGICLLFFGNWAWVAVLYLLRIIIIMLISRGICSNLICQIKFWTLPLFDFLQFIFYIIFSFTIFLPQKNKWE